MNSRDKTVALCGVLAALTLLLSPSRVDAYAFGNIDCNQLVWGSDVVVLARPFSQTRDTDEGEDTDPHDRAHYPYVWVETTFHHQGSAGPHDGPEFRAASPARADIEQ
jgi:hypothetical protein